MEKERKRILILSPHPDDSVLSFGGLIIKSLREGADIYDVCMTAGGPCSNVDKEIRKREHYAAMDFLGVKNSAIVYDDHDGLLDTIPSCQITGYIDKLIDSFRPHELYCTENSEHADHQALYRAFLGSCRVKAGWRPELIATGTYVFSSQLYLSGDGGKIYNRLNEEDYEKKKTAFLMYQSQLRPYPSPLGEEGLRAMSEYHGMMCGAKYAELYYQLLRVIS